MLFVRGGALMIDGSPCKEIGVNAYFEFLKVLRDNNDTTYIASLDKLQEYGVRVVRCLITPLWSGGTGGWATYDTAGGMTAGYYALLDAFMNACAARNIQLIMPLFWRHATVPDLFAQTVGNMGTVGSASLTYAVSLATEMATRYKDHPACGAWQVGNEWTHYSRTNGLPTISVPNGTPASYNSPADLLTPAQCQVAVRAISNAIRAVDSRRAILGVSGRLFNGVPTTNPVTGAGRAWAQGEYNTGAVDTYGIHIYSGDECGPDGLYGLVEWCSVARSGANRMPIVVDEIGVAEDDATRAVTWAEINEFMHDPRAPELVLLWNWGDRTTWFNGDVRWDIFPGVNKEYQAVAIRSSQAARRGPALVEGRAFQPTSWGRFGGVSDCVYLHAGAVPKSDSWMVTFWARYMGRPTSSGSFLRVISFGDESTDGFFVQRHTDGRLYAQVTLASGQVNTYLRAPVNPGNAWVHHAIGWDAATNKLRHVVNGRLSSSDATHAANYVKGVDRNFVIGASNSLATGWHGDLFDVRYYDTSLNMLDIYQAYLGRATSIDPKVRELYSGIGPLLAIGGAPEWGALRPVEVAG